MTRVVVVGAGVVGLFSALHALRRGFDVTVVDRDAAGHRGCSYGNAGMVVPSHFVPLAAPGMVRLGLRWMMDPASPFHVKPRLSSDFATWRGGSSARRPTPMCSALRRCCATSRWPAAQFTKRSTASFPATSASSATG
jgi:glycine/D-amino acid oxidase-like deaminating enzyme